MCPRRCQGFLLFFFFFAHITTLAFLIGVRTYLSCILFREKREEGEARGRRGQSVLIMSVRMICCRATTGYRPLTHQPPTHPILGRSVRQSSVHPVRVSIRLIAEEITVKRNRRNRRREREEMNILKGAIDVGGGGDGG